MEKNWCPQLYKKKATQQNIDNGLLISLIAIGNNITLKNPSAAPVFTLNHLSYVTDVNYGLLRSYVSRYDDDDNHKYRIFRIRKKGKVIRMRTICVPAPSLLLVQKYIHLHILSKIKPHDASIAYLKKQQIVKSVKIHCGCRWLIKLDIKNFFEAIPESAVYKVFKNAGYPELLSFEMARLCTRVIPPNHFEEGIVKSNVNKKKYSINSYNINSSVEGSLPQGAPTSPMLANLVAAKLDEDIMKIAEKHGLYYTRYADDISLSTDDLEFNRRKAMQVINIIYVIMRKHGLSPNTSKTFISPPGTRKVILGLLVDSDTPRLTKKFKSKLRQHLYFCQKKDIGPVKHAKHRGFSATLGFKNHLRGLIAYAKQIEPEFGQSMFKLFNEIQWPV